MDREIVLAVLAIVLTGTTLQLGVLWHPVEPVIDGRYGARPTA